MSKTVAELQEKLIKQMKQINKTREVASRRPIDLTTLKELWEDSPIPPYALTTIAAYKFGPELYSDITEEPSNGRVRSKVEEGILKAFAGFCSGVMCATLVPLIALIDSTYSLPGVGVLGAQSAVYTNYNKNIEKAKTKLKKLEHEYNITLEEFHKAKQQEQQSEIEL